MKENFDGEKIKTIRMRCACGLEFGKIKKLKELFGNNRDLVDFVNKANKLNQGFTIEYDGKYSYLYYPQCYCSSVKRINKTISKEWCYCTLGYTKRMFELI